MIVGFTGTRAGLTDRQRRILRETLERLRATEFHHGDCVGADLEAHVVAASMGIPVFVHPCDIAGQRAWCQGAAKTFPVKRPRDRNRDIVDASDVLIACPRTMAESSEPRSGTWMTIRYAIGEGETDVAVVWPETGEGRRR